MSAHLAAKSKNQMIRRRFPKRSVAKGSRKILKSSVLPSELQDDLRDSTHDAP